MKPGVSSLNPYAASYIPLSKREACDRTEPTTKGPKSGNENVWYPGHVTQSQHHGRVSYDSIAQGAQKHPISEGSTMKSYPLLGSYGSSSKQMMDEKFEMDLEYLQMTFSGLSDQSLTDVYLANNHDLEASVAKLTQLEIAQGAQKHPISEGSTMKSYPLLGSYGSSSKQMMDEEFEMDLEYLQMSFPGLSDQSLTDVYLANNHDLEASVDMLNQLEFDTVESSENLPETLDIGDVSESGLSSEFAAMKLKTVVGEAAASSSGSPGSAIIS